jgi:formate hydrogenlyase subunit 3/multisubunit Na+/H+ antiporter MnhD subunit
VTACSAAGQAACSRSLVVIALPPPVRGVPALDLSIHLDGLAALFVAVAGFCATAIAVYSLGWLRDDPLRDAVAGSFSLFVGATLLVLVVNSVFWLFVALELVTLASADLVRYRGRVGGSIEASRTALRTYLLVSHFGLMLVLAGLLPVAVTRGAIDLDVLRLPGTTTVPAASFCLVLLGLSMRAGLVPFHFWVPVVHPQLPTNTHAMMSAVMLKLTVYLMIRMFFERVLGPVTWWWGALLLVLASVTAVVTVFYALLSKDLKTALAYHSVENVGIILAGVGLALLLGDESWGSDPARRGAAAVALLASLYHVVNHALFKTLLFLCTGSIERRTGTVRIGDLGGLLRHAPWTGVTFLVGAVAIAGLPPLNGFISEWLTLQSLLGGKAVYRPGGAMALVTMAAVATALIGLAMAMAVTAVAFLKITGEAVLGQRRWADDGVREGRPVRAVLGALAGVCLLLGLQPWLLVPWLSAAVAPEHVDLSVLHATPTGLSIELPAAGGEVPYRAALPVLPLILLCLLPVVLLLLLRWGGWERRPVWAGGQPFAPDRMEYTGGAFSALVWEPVAREHHMIHGTPLPTAFRVSPRRVVVEQGNRLYNCLVRVVLQVSERIGRSLANGDIRSYLLYIFSAVVAVLALLTAVH